MRQTDVAVIGAGPAGAVCGYLLQKSGVACVVVDFATFPRDKVCGGGLTPKAFKLLDEIYPDLHYDYNLVSRIRLVIDDTHRCEFDIDDEQRILRIVKRRDFDNLLVQRYLDAGGELLKGAFADFEEHRGDEYPVVVTLRSGEQIACKYLVGADGATSLVRRRLAPQSQNGLFCMEQYRDRQGQPAEPAITIGMSERYDHGYFYCFPNLTHDVVGFGALQITKDQFVQVVGEMGFGGEDADKHVHGAWIPRASVVPTSPRIILIGDAGGFTNRVSYEGLYYAFATAQNACRTIVDGVDFRLVNKVIYRKKRKEDFLDKCVYSHAGIATLKLLAKSPGLVKSFYNFFV